MRKIRTIQKPEWCVDPSDRQEIITFFGHQYAVRLVYRNGNEDTHVCFEILSEDDDHWFHYTGGGGSSYWIPDMRRVLNAANRWLKKNAKPDIYNGKQFGYKI